MAIALLARSLSGLRSFRPPIRRTSKAPIPSPFIFRRLVCCLVHPTLFVSATASSLHCNATGSAQACKASYTTHSLTSADPVVSADWLHDHLGDPYLKILDATWCLPTEKRNPLQEYQMAHIPDALFFDIDGISDRSSSLPQMLPSNEAFAAAVSALGIQNQDGVIVYDGKGLLSAPRVWWMFRVFGHDKVWVLDGGLPRWRASGYDVESRASEDSVVKPNAASEAVEKVYQGKVVAPTSFETRFQPHLIWTFEQVKQNIEERTHQLIDARPKPRFDGIAPEYQIGVRSGHVPGSKSIPFPKMVDSNQCLLPASELTQVFEGEGLSLDRPVVASCAIGLTACILALGLHRLGKTDVPVYDGSWTEWGGRPDTPVSTA